MSDIDNGIFNSYQFCSPLSLSDVPHRCSLMFFQDCSGSVQTGSAGRGQSQGQVLLHVCLSAVLTCLSACVDLPVCLQERRPFLASECSELPKAEKWRRQVRPLYCLFFLQYTFCGTYFIITLLYTLVHIIAKLLIHHNVAYSTQKYLVLNIQFVLCIHSLQYTVYYGGAQQSLQASDLN